MLIRLLRRLLFKKVKKTGVYRVRFDFGFIKEKDLRKGLQRALVHATKQDIDAVVESLSGKSGCKCSVAIRLGPKDVKRLYKAFKKYPGFSTSKRYRLWESYEEWEKAEPYNVCREGCCAHHMLTSGDRSPYDYGVVS